MQQVSTQQHRSSAIRHKPKAVTIARAILKFEKNDISSPEEGILANLDLRWIRAKSRWCIAVVDHFGMRHTTAELATHILCRYLQCGRVTEIPNDQIVRCSTAASLSIAMIFNEQYHMPRSELIRMGEDRFTEEEIIQSELHISHCLGDGIVLPTIETYVKKIFEECLHNLANGVPAVIEEALEELICIAIDGLLFLEIPAQLLGLGVFVLALRLCHGHDIWEAQVALLYKTIGIKQDSALANDVSGVCARLFILHQHVPLN